MPSSLTPRLGLLSARAGGWQACLLSPGHPHSTGSTCCRGPPSRQKTAPPGSPGRSSSSSSRGLVLGVLIDV